MFWVFLNFEALALVEIGMKGKRGNFGLLVLNSSSSSDYFAGLVFLVFVWRCVNFVLLLGCVVIV